MKQKATARRWQIIRRRRKNTVRSSCAEDLQIIVSECGYETPQPVASDREDVRCQPTQKVDAENKKSRTEIFWRPFSYSFYKLTLFWTKYVGSSTTKIEFRKIITQFKQLEHLTINASAMHVLGNSAHCGPLPSVATSEILVRRFESIKRTINGNFSVSEHGATIIYEYH